MDRVLINVQCIDCAKLLQPVMDVLMLLYTSAKEVVFLLRSVCVTCVFVSVQKYLKILWTVLECISKEEC